jgi:hypothetical protein
LIALVAVQVLLGVESWMIRFASGALAYYQPSTLGQALLRSGHFLAGSGIFATSVIMSLWACRLSASPERERRAHHSTEAVA